MRLEALVLVAALASAAPAVTSSSPIKDLLQQFIKELQGDKKHYFDKIELTKDARFENVMVESSVDEIFLDMEDRLPHVNIKALKAPIKLLRASGLYTFQDLVLPGGLTVYGKGKFVISFEELNLSLSLRMKYEGRTGLWMVENVTVTPSLKSALVKFDNLMDGEPMGDFIHEMINKLIPVLVELLPGLVDENKTAIMKIISDVINVILNRQLA